MFGASNQRKSHAGLAAFPLSHRSLARYSSTHPSLQSAQALPLKRYFYRDHLPLDRPLFVLPVQPQGNNKITGFLPYFWVPPVLWRYGVSVFGSLRIRCLPPPLSCRDCGGIEQKSTQVIYLFLLEFACWIMHSRISKKYGPCSPLLVFYIMLLVKKIIMSSQNAQDDYLYSKWNGVGVLSSTWLEAPVWWAMIQKPQ